MKILFLGDIVGENGRNVVSNHLESLVKKYEIDFVIANGENATHGKGLIEKHYNQLIDSGIDVITLGNHYLSKNKILEYIDDATCLVRPLNIIKNFGGVGSLVVDVDSVKIRVSNILGTAFMSEEVSSPYFSIKQILDENKDEDSIHIVDFHAETTSEKQVLGYLLDGHVSAVLGTHTHVQTNDAHILKNGTGFMCDIGMCGAANGVLGCEKTSVINKTIFGSNEKFDFDKNDTPMINGVVLSIDNFTKKCVEIFPINIIYEN